MDLDDLSPRSIAAALPKRQTRFYRALLSTGADALAWARSGAAEGAVVVADYQASPRGRAGLEWQVVPGRSLGFSLVLRPRLPPEREGWLYTVATSGLADALGPHSTIEWPDEVSRQRRRVGAVGVHVELGPKGSDWATVDVLVPETSGSRSTLLARVVKAIESRYRMPPDEVLQDYLPRCQTIGRKVRARLIPMGPSGPQVTGIAAGALMDGALLLETERGARVAVRPQNLGRLEHLDQEGEGSTR